jgi:hypothetical protein
MAARPAAIERRSYPSDREAMPRHICSSATPPHVSAKSALTEATWVMTSTRSPRPKHWLERCGRLDILVNNAGTNIRHPAHETPMNAG